MGSKDFKTFIVSYLETLGTEKGYNKTYDGPGDLTWLLNDSVYASFLIHFRLKTATGEGTRKEYKGQLVKALKADPRYIIFVAATDGEISHRRKIDITFDNLKTTFNYVKRFLRKPSEVHLLHLLLRKDQRIGIIQIANRTEFESELNRIILDLPSKLRTNILKEFRLKPGVYQTEVRSILRDLGIKHKFLSY